MNPMTGTAGLIPKKENYECEAMVSVLSEDENAKLASAGWSSAGALIEASDSELMSVLGCDVRKIRKARLEWCQKIGVPACLKASEYKSRRIMTALHGLDLALGGGMRTGTLIEFVGRAGCGKTQLCTQIAAAVARQFDGSAIYLDTEGAFRPKRLDQIVKARGWTKNQAQSDDILSRIHVMRLTSADDLLRCLSENDAIERQARDTKAKVIVLDSVAALARADFAGRVIDRQAWLATAAASLKRIAARHDLVALVTNHVVADFSSSHSGQKTNSSGYDGRDPVAPALGLLWSHCVTTRCFLEKIGKSAQDDHLYLDQSNKVLNISEVSTNPSLPLGQLTIVKAPDLPNTSVRYRIDAAGLLDHS